MLRAFIGRGVSGSAVFLEGANVTGFYWPWVFMVCCFFGGGKCYGLLLAWGFRVCCFFAVLLVYLPHGGIGCLAGGGYFCCRCLFNGVLYGFGGASALFTVFFPILDWHPLRDPRLEFC